MAPRPRPLLAVLALLFPLASASYSLVLAGDAGDPACPCIDISQHNATHANTNVNGTSCAMRAELDTSPCSCAC